LIFTTKKSSRKWCLNFEFNLNSLSHFCWGIRLKSISSTFYARVFCMKFWHQKLQSCVLGLKFFGTKILYEKCAGKTLMKLTPYLVIELHVQQSLSQIQTNKSRWLFLSYFWPLLSRVFLVRIGNWLEPDTKPP